MIIFRYFIHKDEDADRCERLEHAPELELERVCVRGILELINFVFYTL